MRSSPARLAHLAPTTMTALHLPTAYFIAGILYLMVPAAVWVTLPKQHAPNNTL
ncbi:hypothetical protein [uncultured Limnohabitans sp.]|uniref:hypothetical protein n=1 Tax=uncultured Limnohabitans sp. TaxID=768543 RepID=UPI00262612AB|nr:hypothetical protein [uncultured Limnohabitans sp.]